MRYFIVLLCVQAFCLVTFSQEVSSSLLWEIKGKKVKTPSYLFGTMHLIPQEDFLFPKSLQEKVINSDLLIMEIGGLSEQMSAVKFLLLDSGNLFDYFTAIQQDSLFLYFETELNESKESVKAKYGGMKPLVLLQLLTQNAFGENPSSYEMSLEAIARKNNVPIEGLETIEEQIGFFDKLSMSEQVEMVMSSLRHSASSKEEMEKLIESYLSQNVDSIASLITNAEVGTDLFEEQFLTQRNIDWIPAIKNHLRKSSCFIAVGAGHLGGEKGIIQLLREEGYTLEPILLE